MTLVASQSCRYKHAFHCKTVGLMRQKRSAVLSKSGVWRWLKSGGLLSTSPPSTKLLKKYGSAFVFKDWKPPQLVARSESRETFCWKEQEVGREKTENEGKLEGKEGGKCERKRCNVWDGDVNREECACVYAWVCACKLMVMCLKGWNGGLVVLECFPWHRWPEKQSRTGRSES